MTELETPFADRHDAGRQLAELLVAYEGRDDLLVLGLPRGGIPVAYEVARRLNAPLDVLVVRKLGAPANPELAMGAIASGGIVVRDPDVLRLFDDEALERVIETERRELERREAAYRDNRPPPRIEGRTVILVDDGIATGSTMRAGAAALRQQKPRRLVIAVPVGPPGTRERLGADADEVVCGAEPRWFGAIGAFYRDFDQTTDDEVRELLASATRYRRASRDADERSSR